jgi:hypothetical protein
MKISEESPLKDQVDAAVRQYGAVPRSKLPRWLLQPGGRYQFDLAPAVWACQHPGWDSAPYPVYGSDGRLDHWRGIKLKDECS